MRVEAVPVIGLGHRVPGPIGGLEVLEDDARLLVLVRRVAPDVKVARRGCPVSAPARRLKPGMLVRGVIEHQLGDHPQAAPVRLAQEQP